MRARDVGGLPPRGGAPHRVESLTSRYFMSSYMARPGPRRRGRQEEGDGTALIRPCLCLPERAHQSTEAGSSTGAERRPKPDPDASHDQPTEPTMSGTQMRSENATQDPKAGMVDLKLEV